MSDTQSAIGVSAATISQKVTATTGVGSFLGFIAKIDVIAWGGLFIAVIGLAIQFYYAWKKNQRETIEHEMRKAEYELRKKRLQGGRNVEQD